MAETTQNSRRKWLLIILIIIVLAAAAFFIIKAMHGDGSSFKEYGTEQSADGITVKLNTVERLPMENEKCLERVLLIGKKEDFTCVIANITITNNTGKEYDYSYRNFGYRQTGEDKLRAPAITLTSFTGIDITKDMAAGESHTQDVFYSIQKRFNLSDISMIYKVNPKAEDGKSEIALPL
jgi:hypothetical protein